MSDIDFLIIRKDKLDSSLGYDDLVFYGMFNFFPPQPIIDQYNSLLPKVNMELTSLYDYICQIRSSLCKGNS